MRTEHTRSIQTISHSTELVKTFFDDTTEKVFSVRRLSVRKDPNRQLFIVTIENDTKSDEYKVVPFAELSYRKKKVNVVVDPNIQYPELNQSITNVIEKIKSSILGYMSNYQKLSVH
ncbi:hypothetical protein [Providencia sneebia]|uniref:Uncharacterized protein n=1 Tax=Providencia sneebia DSM 19967 TaxID=1141660 RepID=K8WHP8_9GAMM|nr:hypothetical protein [Providencia sneebia]EKT55770.1 hypothetical protein OO7_12374 [Providencia sneebia DSM 19967]